MTVDLGALVVAARWPYGAQCDYRHQLVHNGRLLDIFGHPFAHDRWPGPGWFGDVDRAMLERLAAITPPLVTFLVLWEKAQTDTEDDLVKGLRYIITAGRVITVTRRPSGPGEVDEEGARELLAVARAAASAVS